MRDRGVGAGEVARFRTGLVHALGLRFDEAAEGHLADVLGRRLDAAGRDAPAYLDGLERLTLPPAELGALGEALTVPESSFFRYRAQLDALVEEALPDRAARRRPGHRLQVLSAGCAGGEEPYTVAILMAERTDPTWDVSIRAVDLNPAALARARRAHYSDWSLRDTPAEVRRRWFRPAGSTPPDPGTTAVLDPAIRDAVRFEARNLNQPAPDLWAPETFDVVLCRNVLMYFDPDRARALVARIIRALAPGGYLFLGHAENLRGLTNDVDLCQRDGSFFYRRREILTDRAGGSGVGARDGMPLASLVDEAGTWMETIHLATERVRALTDRSSGATGPGTDPSAAPVPPWDLTAALALLRQERFGEALDLVEALPPAAAADGDVALLRASLLAHGGDLDRAEEACRRLLDDAPLNAGGHYLLALCREAAGDLDGAAEHDRTASHLDDSFAMPHVHLGLLARRLGDPATSADQLGRAVTLLQQEDPSRLLLFGGGFSRDALTALCRAELDRTAPAARSTGDG